MFEGRGWTLPLAQCTSYACQWHPLLFCIHLSLNAPAPLFFTALHQVTLYFCLLKFFVKSSRNALKLHGICAVLHLMTSVFLICHPMNPIFARKLSVMAVIFACEAHPGLFPLFLFWWTWASLLFWCYSLVLLLIPCVVISFDFLSF